VKIGRPECVELVTLHSGKPKRGGKANLWPEQS